MNTSTVDPRPRTPLSLRTASLSVIGLLLAGSAKAAWTVGYFIRVLACLGILNEIAILGGQKLDAMTTLGACEITHYCSDEHIARLESLISSLNADISAAWARYRARGCDR